MITRHTIADSLHLYYPTEAALDAHYWHEQARQLRSDLGEAVALLETVWREGWPTHTKEPGCKACLVAREVRRLRNRFEETRE